MELYEAIEKRRTIRDFDSEVIPQEVIERVISAAMKAPTNDHMRDWHYIVIKDREVAAGLLDIVPKGISDEDMDQLIDRLKRQQAIIPRSVFSHFVGSDSDGFDNIQQECYRNAVPKQYRMLFDASAIIVPLMKQKTDILHPENISHLNGFASIWCSIENIFLAATAEGYGCNLRIPLGNESEHAREVLGYPEDYYMPCFIGIGKPEENAPIRRAQSITRL